jgi:predicted outer membrane protein
MHARHGIALVALFVGASACSSGVTFPARQSGAFVPSRPNTSGQESAYGATAPGAPGGTSTSPIPVETTTAVVERRPPSRGEILTVMAALDRREIQLARLATRRARSPQVRDLAASLLVRRDAGTFDRQEYASAAKVSYRPTPEAAAVLEDTNDSLDDLRARPSREFDEAFLDAIVDDKEEALEFLDNQALEADADPALQGLLRAYRRAISRELEATERVRDRLESAGST